MLKILVIRTKKRLPTLTWHVSKLKAKNETQLVRSFFFLINSCQKEAQSYFCSGDVSSGDSDENDEDFKPGEESDVAEEYDSNVATTDSDDSDASGGAKPRKAGSDSGSDSDSKPKKKEKKEKKESKKSSSSKSAVSHNLKRTTNRFLHTFFCHLDS